MIKYRFGHFFIMFSFLRTLFSSSDAEPLRQRTLLRFFFFLLALFTVVFGTVFVLMLRPAKTYLMPDLKGKELLTTLRLLQKNHLHYHVQQSYHKDVPSYHIISQRPDPGTPVKERRNVQLIVSLGQKVTKMPDFTGMEMDEARAELLSLFSGFEKIPVIVPNSRYSTNYPEGKIFNQSPKPGLPINLDQNILFLVSRGIATNTLVLSNFRWKNYKDVERMLDDYGCDVTFHPIETIHERRIGQVYRQQPPPGSSVNKGDSVTLYVGIKKGHSRELREMLHIYSIKVPFKSAEDLQNFLKKADQLKEHPFPVPSKGNEQLSPSARYALRLARHLKLIVIDEAGTENRFDEVVLPGIYVDIPYRAYGSGTLEVYLDGELHDRVEFAATSQ